MPGLMLLLTIRFCWQVGRASCQGTLSPVAWQRVKFAFGPLSLDLMAIPSNVKCDQSGHPLWFFSRFPCPQAAGTNVFAQNIPPDENAFVFPPFVLIGPLVKLLSSQGRSFSIVMPDLCPCKFWWPLVERSASSAFRVCLQHEMAK